MSSSAPRRQPLPAACAASLPHAEAELPQRVQPSAVPEASHSRRGTQPPAASRSLRARTRGRATAAPLSNSTLPSRRHREQVSHALQRVRGRTAKLITGASKAKSCNSRSPSPARFCIAKRSSIRTRSRRHCPRHAGETRYPHQSQPARSPSGSHRLAPLFRLPVGWR